jgi:predicted RNA-binding protein with RPS1 domain
MAQEWDVLCKSCGKSFGYSHRSYQAKASSLGYSRPEYCDDCRGEHRREKSSFGSGYFHRDFKMINLEGGDICLGVERFDEYRFHVGTQEDSGYAEEKEKGKFALTEDKVRAVFDWLSDSSHRVVVIVGPTGSGKSTALPYWLLNPPEGIESDWFSRNGQMIITQPRKIPTEDIPKYVASRLHGGRVGRGYDISLRHSGARHTNDWNLMYYCTDGTLINLVGSGGLADISLVMLDEAHERSLNIDTILFLLRQKLFLYPQLKILIASATINAELFRDFFGEDTAKIVEFTGKKPYKVQEFFAQEQNALPYNDLNALREVIVGAVTKEALRLLDGMIQGKKERGDMLIFLASIGDIDEAVGRLSEAVKDDPRFSRMVEYVRPLHAQLSDSDRKIVLTENKDFSRVRVIVCTNAAETSITVHGVVYVVDSGLINESYWDMETEEARLPMVLHSQAGCRQRWGRAGRIRDGEAFCLYTKEQFEKLFPKYTTPEIQRSCMDGTLLQAAAHGAFGVSTFDRWLEAPKSHEMERAFAALRQYRALDREGDLTLHGNTLRSFEKYSVSMAQMIIAADRFGCVVELATLLPVFKDGGKRNLLIRDYKWDAVTKHVVDEIHLNLMEGCRDDVDFGLKLFALWSSLPEGEARESWARDHFVNHEVLQEGILSERNELMHALSENKKDYLVRPVDFRNADAVRIILAFYRPKYRQHGLEVGRLRETYIWERHPVDTKGQRLPYAIAIHPEWMTELSRLDVTSRPEIGLGRLIAESRQAFDKRKEWHWTRLFIGQEFPVGSLWEFEGFRSGQVRGERHFHWWFRKSTRFGFEDDLKYSFVFQGTKRDIGQIRQRQGEGLPLYFRVTDYNFRNSQVEVIIKPFFSWEAQEEFLSQAKDGSIVKICVTEAECFLENGGMALCAKETSFGLESVLAPEDINFIFSEKTISLVEKHAGKNVLAAELTGRIPEWRMPKFSLLRALERKLDVVNFPEGGYVRVEGEVLEVRSSGNVVFLIRKWSDFAKGVVVLALGMSKSIGAEKESWTERERYELTIRNPRRRFHKVALTRREELSVYEDAIKRIGGVVLEEESLACRGRLSSSHKQKLQEVLPDDVDWRNDVERLYRRSQQFWVEKVTSIRVLEHIRSRYAVDAIVQGRVREIKYGQNGSLLGIVVELEDGVEGLVHVKEMYGWVERAEDVARVGEIVEVKVLSADHENRRYQLSMRTPKNNPYVRIAAIHSCG